MTALTRRTVMTGAAAMAAGTSLPVAPPAFAQASGGGQQNEGWYRYKVGDIEITAVTDGMSRFKFPDTFVTNKSRDDVNEALEAAFMDKDMMAIPYTPIAIRNGDKLTVIDTGTGEANFEKSKGSSGQFQRNLAASGIDAKGVSTVVISHFHGDHINGLLKADNSLAFPNAEILVPDVEYKYWMDDAERARHTSGRLKGQFDNVRRVFAVADVKKRVKPYADGKEIVPGITAVATHGHSPGHTSHMISSGNKTVFAQADVTNVPFIFARNPGWHAMFDHIPDMAEATRRKVYDMLASERTMVQGFHYPFPAVAHVEKSGDGYRTVPVPWSPTI